MDTHSSGKRWARPRALSEAAILVVEPDPDQQWRVARMLTVQGHRVIGTATGDGAIAVLGQCPIKLVLVADSLPPALGGDLVRELQRLHPEVPVVLMTVDGGHTESALLAAKHPISRIVPKPLSMDVLTQLSNELDRPAKPSAIRAG